MVHSFYVIILVVLHFVAVQVFSHWRVEAPLLVAVPNLIVVASLGHGATGSRHTDLVYPQHAEIFLDQGQTVFPALLEPFFLPLGTWKPGSCTHYYLRSF